MTSPFRKESVAALRAAGEERPMVTLVPPRRWLTALSLVVMLIAGVIFVTVASTKDPIRGIGYVDRGGFVVLGANMLGIVQDGVVLPGTPVEAGDVLARVISSDGATMRVIAPVPGVVMQLLGPPTGWVSTQGDPIIVLARTDVQVGAEATLLLPGLAATEVRSGDVTEGSTVWLEPADRQPLKCIVESVRPYAQPAESVAEFMPDPYVASYLTDLGSVQMAKANCPDGSLDWALPGAVMPVTVEAGSRSPLKSILGSGS
jgi:hypothetical protein